jgi:hypothetical protein
MTTYRFTIINAITAQTVWADTLTEAEAKHREYRAMRSTFTGGPLYSVGSIQRVEPIR